MDQKCPFYTCSSSPGRFLSHWDKQLRPMGPTWSVPPAFNPLTSSLTFAASTPATLASLMHLEHTTHMAIGLLHLLFPLPRTLSSRHPHGSLSVFFRSLFKCYLVREAFPDPSLKIATPLSPLSVPLVLIFSIAPFNIFYLSFSLPQQERKFHAGRDFC